MKAIIIISLLILSGCNIAGKAFDANQNGVIDESEINLNAEDMKACCTYLDENNEGKTCYLLKKYGCELCESACG